jgi:CAAX protease family protein
MKRRKENNMRRFPVAWFYILAFAITWLGWIPPALGSHGIAPFDKPYFQFLLIFPVIGPALAAILVTQMTQGKTGVRDLLKPLLQWRVGLVWYLVAVLGPLVLLIAGKAITNLLGEVTPAGPQGNLFFVAISAFAMSFFGNTCEEIGWRGFALPRLQKRYNALLATLPVGVLWGLWHLPLFFWVGNPMSEYPFLPWFIGTVALAFIYTWLYNSTQGSIVIVALFHVALNTFAAIVSGVSKLGLAIPCCLVAIALVAAFGSTNLSRQERVSAG